MEGRRLAPVPTNADLEKEYTKSNVGAGVSAHAA